MSELRIFHLTFGSMTPSEAVEMTREVMHGEVPLPTYHPKLTHALALMIQRLDELRRDQLDETKAAMARSKVDGVETATQFADRFAGKLDAMSIAIAATALEGSWNASRSTAFRDAARLLREEVGL